jgi:AcrR family transcriptional regulator
MARIPADVRRQELVEAAIRVMARDGIARATTRAIVAEAGMQLGFFHYCFRSKEELLQGVIETIAAHNDQATMSVVAPGRGLRDTLTASFRGYLDGVERNPEEHQLTYELTQYAMRQDGFDGVAAKQYETYVASTTRYLTAAAEVTGIEWTAPVAVLARYVSNLVDGVTLAWIVDRDTAAAIAVLDQAVEHLVSNARSVARSAANGRP